MRRKSWVLSLLISISITLLIKDAIIVFADALSPDQLQTITMKLVKCPNSSVQEVKIIEEGKDKELFSLLKEEILSKGQENQYNGWHFIQGEKGKAWTTIQVSQEGEPITICTKVDSESYLAMLRNIWSGTIEVSVNNEAPRTIEAYKEITSSEIIRVYPFKLSYQRAFRITICFALANLILYAIVYCFLKQEQLRNETDRRNKV